MGRAHLPLVAPQVARSRRREDKFENLDELKRALGRAVIGRNLNLGGIQDLIGIPKSAASVTQRGSECYGGTNRLI